MGLKIFLFVESRRNWAVRQLHYTVILTSKSNMMYYVSPEYAGGIYYALESGEKPGEEYGISMWV